jgi:hypothetical protein
MYSCCIQVFMALGLFEFPSIFRQYCSISEGVNTPLVSCAHPDKETIMSRINIAFLIFQFVRTTYCTRYLTKERFKRFELFERLEPFHKLAYLIYCRMFHLNITDPVLIKHEQN